MTRPGLHEIITPVSKVCEEISASGIGVSPSPARLHGQGIRSVVYTDEHGAEQNPTIRLVDHREVDNNDFLVVNQVDVRDGDARRRFDVVLFLNGLPVGLIEMKKAGDAYADLEGAQAQIRTYVEELPLAFRANVACVVSNGITAATAPRSRRTSTTRRGTSIRTASRCRNLPPGTMILP